MWVDSVGLLDFRSSRSLLGLMSYLLSFPSQPVTDSPAHDQFEVAALQPGQLFREQRHALAPRARHARDVGAPEPARGAEGVIEAVQIVVDVAKRIGRSPPCRLSLRSGPCPRRAASASRSYSGRSRSRRSLP